MASKRVLGLVRDTGNPKLDTVLEKLEAHDFAPVTKSCIDRYRWTSRRAKAAELETKRFFSLAFLDPGQYHIPEADVDEYWHRMILHTKWYTEFCLTMFGDYYHHTPEPDMKNLNETNRRRSLGLIKHWYGRTWKSLVATCTQCKGGGVPTKVTGLEPAEPARYKG